MITFKNHTISNMVITSMMGPSGGGDNFPLTLLPSYHRVVNAVYESGATSISKTSTRYDRAGFFRWWKFWETIKKVRQFYGATIGLQNAFGLKNDGIEINAPKVLAARRQGFNVIVSYAPEFSRGLETAIKEALEVISILKLILGEEFWAIEFNAGCPNSGESIEDNQSNFLQLIRAVRANFNGCIIVKISPVHSVDFALELEKAGVDVVHALNTVPHYFLYPDNRIKSRMAKFNGGGYSGPYVADLGFRKNRELRAALHVPMILGLGINDFEDVRKYVNMIKGFPHTSLKENSLAMCTAYRINTREACAITRMHKNIF